MATMCFVAALFFLCVLSGAENKDVSNGFSSTHSKYTVVYPHISHREKRSANRTSDSIERHETISYEVDINDRKHLLVLKQNRDFISKKFVQYSHHNSGSSKSTSAIRVHCYYHGHVDGYEDSLVILSTCSGLRGVIILRNETYGLEPVPQSPSDEHRLYLLEDMVSGGKVCGVAHETPAQEQHSAFDPGHTVTSLLRRKRNLPQTNYVELVLVVDNLRYKIKESNETAVTEEMVEMANLLDGYYKRLNIRVALVGLEIFKEANPFNVELSAGEVLSEFVNWRKTNLLKRVKHDSAQLMLGLPGPIDGGILGMAFVGTICSSATSGGINVFQRDTTLPYVSAVVAHELGHNLGMNHDNDRCECGNKCIMAASAGGTNFSSCSADDFEVLVRNGGGLCLRNPPTFSVGLSQCGNGLLEEEEQCDCGTPEECTNECCDAATCRFSSGSACADGLCCDNCQIKVAGTLCRGSLDECDLPEYCVGDSGFCPEDFYIMDGLGCAGDSAQCFEGRCQTYDAQCKILFQPSAQKANDICFQHANVKGDKFGSCGYAKSKPVPCSVENVMCGKLQCTEVDANKPPPGGSLSNSMISGFKCVNADFNLGTDVVDPAFVNTGSPCAEGKACLDFQCVNSSALLPDLDCNAQTTCNNNGVCNDQGHCHCGNGWAPPLCDRSGRGGSVDSGPAQIDNSLRDGLLIFFLLVVPVLVLVILLLLYFFRRDALTGLFKARKRGANDNNRPQNAQHRGGNDQTNVGIPPNTVVPPHEMPSERTTLPPTPGFRYGELDYWGDVSASAQPVPKSVPQAVYPSVPPSIPRPAPPQGPGVPRPIEPRQPPN